MYSTLHKPLPSRRSIASLRRLWRLDHIRAALISTPSRRLATAAHAYEDPPNDEEPPFAYGDSTVLPIISRPESHIGKNGVEDNPRARWARALEHGYVKPSLHILGATDFKPSEEQQAILNEVAHGTSRILVVDAKAGSGKTTTLLQCLRHIPNAKDVTVALMAYNRINAELIAHRVRELQGEPNMRHLHTQAHTFHAYGRATWVKHLKLENNGSDIHIAPDKTWHILQSMLTRDELLLYGPQVVNLVALAKLHCIAPKHDSLIKAPPVRPNTDQELIALADVHRIKPKKGGDMRMLVQTARACMMRSLIWAGALQPATSRTRDRLRYVSRALQDDSRRIENMQARSATAAAQAAEAEDGEMVPLDEISIRQLRMAQAVVEQNKFILDFDDLLYLPIIHGAEFPKFDYVFVDEAQDMSAARATIVEKVLKPSGRLFLFGDERQQIYQFAGATEDLFADLAHRGVAREGIMAAKAQKPEPADSPAPLLQAKKEIVTSLAQIEQVRSLPMSLCRRCPTSVIQLAQRLVPEITAAPNAPRGEICTVKGELDINQFRAVPTMVVARKVLPLLNFAYYLMAHNVRVHVPGRAIGCDMAELVEFAVRGLDLRNADDTRRLSAKLLAFRKDLTEERLLEKAPPRLAAGGLPFFDDRLDSLLTILKHSNTHPPGSPGSEGAYAGRSVQDFKQHLLDFEWVGGGHGVGGSGTKTIKRAPPVVLATFHRSRGLETENVVILNEMDHLKKFAGSSDPAKNDPYRVTEANLMYIAYTRAKARLSFAKWQPEPMYEYVLSRETCPVTGFVTESRARPYRSSTGEPAESDAYVWDSTYEHKLSLRQEEVATSADIASFVKLWKEQLGCSPQLSY
ncbi:hypothetical protein HDU87_000727 [Geranomyces variabilis]|uniref:UvrD-like helicase ATP-binding domain-containing protein n=1 Tax=Geranomyces variabilis TaxID=109894 RepID=A0AAD5TT29_9FUNG|nr:hypothetical protein HDU87_000727 [Geranomyces variabilis]